MSTRLSSHARHRASQRGLTADDIAFVLAFGRRLHRTGIRFVFLAQRDVPARFARSHGHLAGATLLVAHDGTVLTVYKNAEAIRVIKKKEKNRRRPLVLASA